MLPESAGALSEVSPLGGGCAFGAIFPVKMSRDGLYRVTAGNSNRGFLNRIESDFLDEGDHLRVSINACELGCE